MLSLFKFLPDWIISILPTHSNRNNTFLSKSFDKLTNITREIHGTTEIRAKKPFFWPTKKIF